MHYLKILLFPLFMLVAMNATAQVDINTADAAALAAAIDGVGEKKARTIIEYRETHGPFARVEDLAEIKGIGSKTVERNRDNLRVGRPAP